jgi:uncharacterized membrane protein YphA (DoxX/SURF4 family)
MAVLRRFARPLLASTFVGGGYGTLRESLRDADAEPEDPTTGAAPADADTSAHPGSFGGPQGGAWTERVRALTRDPRQLALVAGSVQLGAGVLLALGRFPRASSLALAVSLVPGAVAGQPYWTIEDPQERAHRRALFFKDLSLLGGLLLAAADTHGKPSLAYRTRHAAHDATAAADRRLHDAGDGIQHAVGTVSDGVKDLADDLKDFAGDLRDRLPGG